MRIWKLRNSRGEIVPNAFILANDVLFNPRSTAAAKPSFVPGPGQEFDYPNFDYNDNLFLVTNVRPGNGTGYSSELATGNGLPGDPAEKQSNLDFGQVTLGSPAVTQVLNLRSLGKVFPAEDDPNIEISAVEIAGPDRTEFVATMPSKTTIFPHDPLTQNPDTTSIKVSFAPNTVGFKQASLLIYYNSDASPKRVPLFGIATDACNNAVVVKRIKTARNNSKGPLVVKAKSWEPDQNYRTSAGGYKFDTTLVKPVEETDEDAVYETYMSSDADGRSIFYSISVPNGQYTLRLHFAELFQNFANQPNRRVNDIFVEGQKRIFALDICQRSRLPHGAGAGYTRDRERW
ncbi:MAG: hypothetical protein HC880_05590 [Bacteroidia bacterium]|nr:hypothetical protein [Bacteroidia bacterium]